MRAFLAGLLMAGALAAQQQTQPPEEKKATSVKPKDQEPPEEDESFKPKTYTLNPLESERNITAGNFYFKKGNYHAALSRYTEASKWNPGNGEAFLKIAESQEKLDDRKGEREAYQKYLATGPDAKKAEEIKKKLAKLK